MKLATYPPIIKPNVGDRKTIVKTAWWPKRVENRLIWIEAYRQIWEYRVHDRHHVFYGYGILTLKNAPGWDLINEELM